MKDFDKGSRLQKRNVTSKVRAARGKGKGRNWYRQVGLARFTHRARQQRVFYVVLFGTFETCARAHAAAAQPLTL